MRATPSFPASFRASLLAAAAVALPSLLPLGCSPSSSVETNAVAAVDAPPLSVHLVAARELKVPRLLTLSGSLTGAEHADVAAGAAGKILATYVERGSVVKKGAVLARLDARIIGAQAQEAAAQVESLKAQQLNARQECERTQRMFDKGAVAKADYDRAQTQCETSKWSLAAAEAHKLQMAETLHDMEIRAPFAGMVVERAVSAGEYVRVETKVVTMVDVDQLRVELTVPEAAVVDVKAGLPIDFKIASADKDVRFHGHIRYVGPSVRQQTRDAVVEAVVDNPTHALRPGMFVTAELALGEQSLPAVPRTALRAEGVQRHLFVASGGRVEDRLVQAAEPRGPDVPIINGVKVGEMVVEAVTADVRDGARVK
jgi:RND family efflux transporter MFP subunit